MSKKLLLKKILERSKQKKTVLDRLLIAILSLGLLMIVAFFVYVIWFTLTNRSVTQFLPAQNTVAYFELEDFSLPPKLNQNTVLDLVGLKTILKQHFNLNVKKLQGYLSQGRLGLALIREDGEKSELLLFFRARNQKKVLEFFEELALEDEELVTRGDKENLIYYYPQSQLLSFSFIGPYLFIAKQPAVLEGIQAVYSQQEMSLNGDENYKKTISNLPRNVWGHGYLNIQALNFGSGSPINQLIDPLKHITDHLVVTIRKQHNGFHFNALLSLDPELLALKKGYTDPYRFAYSLTDYISSKNLAIYIGGANISDEWQNTLETISQLNPAYGIILEGIVRAQVNKIFGDDVSLRNDIYPLFEGEYALAFENLEIDQMGIKFILKHTDRNFAEAKLEKLLDGFKILAAQFAPKLKVFTLPDGTESRELVADPSRLKEISETYETYEISCLDVTESSYGFCYTITDQLIVMSNNLDTIKETIDLSVSPRFMLSQHQPFRQTLGNLSKVSDEITFIDLGNADQILKNTKVGFITSKLAEPFEAITWIKHYFDDGVSTEGYLLLK